MQRVSPLSNTIHRQTLLFVGSDPYESASIVDSASPTCSVQ
jgi:hypothetical protein